RPPFPNRLNALGGFGSGMPTRKVLLKGACGSAAAAVVYSDRKPVACERQRDAQGFPLEFSGCSPISGGGERAHCWHVPCSRTLRPRAFLSLSARGFLCGRVNAPRPGRRAPESQPSLSAGGRPPVAQIAFRSGS